MKKINKKALVAALAFSVGAAAQASTIDNALSNPLFSLTELNGNAILIAHDAEAKCGEGKCGADKKAKVKAKSVESKCGADKKAKVKAKSAESKCGADKKAAEAKCGEGKCGADKKAGEATDAEKKD